MRLIVGFQPGNAAPKRCPMWFWTSSLGVELRWLWRGGNGNTVADSKKFHIEFCTVATWKNGEIVEERLNYDLLGMLKQIGLM